MFNIVLDKISLAHNQYSMIATTQDGPVPGNHMQKAQIAPISEQPLTFLPNNQIMPTFL